MIYTYYINHRGGVNNLQISKVIKDGVCIKTFKSVKLLAFKRAAKFEFMNNKKAPNC